MDIARQLHVYYGGQRLVHPATNYPITSGGVLPHNNRVNELLAQQLSHNSTLRKQAGRRDAEGQDEQGLQDAASGLCLETLGADCLSQDGAQQTEIASSMCIVQ